MKFVVFAEDWDSHPSSTQHIFKIIAEKHEVIWFNSVGMRTPKIKSKDIKRTISKLKLFNKKQEVNKVVNEKNPLIMPWHNNSINCYFNKKQVEKELSIYSNMPIVYWVSVPTAINMIDVRKEDTLIYYCGDDFSSLEGVDYNLIKRSEDKLIQESDYIFVPSLELMKKFKSKKTILLEHGVDIDLFTKKTSKNKELIGLNNVIGYYGSISSWVDCKLLEKIAKERPNYNLVLIGNAEIDISNLKKFKNVKHIKKIKHNELATFSQYWQVSLMPFLKTKQIHHCNPLKLKEYLAVGKPIVALDFPEIQKFKDVVFLANTHKDFIEKIDEAMILEKSSYNDFKYNCQKLVKKHSWKNKVNFLLNSLLNYNNELKLSTRKEF